MTSTLFRILPAAVLLFVTVALAPASAAAADDALFSPADLDGALPNGARRVLLLAAVPGEATSAAVADLVAALTAIGATSVEPSGMTAPVLLDDHTVVELCTNYRADALAVVEVLTEEPRVLATVKLWKASGERAGSLLGPTAPPPAGATDSSWYISVEGERAFRGTRHVQLDGAAFYEAVGRPDLASSYRGRSAMKSVLVATGTVPLAVGALWGGTLLLLNVIFLPLCSVVEGPHTSQSCFIGLEYYIGPMALGALGGGLMYAAGAMPADPVSAEQRRSLASDYNRRLRGEPSSVRVTPFLTPGGGGLAIGARF